MAIPRNLDRLSCTATVLMFQPAVTAFAILVRLPSDPEHRLYSIYALLQVRIRARASFRALLTIVPGWNLRAMSSASFGDKGALLSIRNFRSHIVPPESQRTGLVYLMIP